MGKITGCLVGWSGKVGNLVFQQVEGVQIVRTHVIPNNPRSASQTLNRTCFTSIVQTFKVLAKEWVAFIWSPLVPAGKKGWGAFIGANKDAMGTSFDPQDAIMSEGSLEGVDDLAATYNTADGELVVSFTGSTLLNGEDTDTCNCVAMDNTTGEVLAYGFNIEARSAEAFGMYLESGLTATEVDVFVTMADTNPASVPPTLVSNSQRVTCSAPV